MKKRRRRRKEERMMIIIVVFLVGHSSKLFFLLLAGIIFEASALLFFREQYLIKNKWLYKGAAYAFILLFMGFILYDTKKLQIRAQACKIADYIRESFKLFLDILNLFLRLLSLKTR